MTQSGVEKIFSYESGEAFAQLMDKKDPLAAFRDAFLVPEAKNGEQVVYMAGNSLGLQPQATRDYIDQELTDWADLGVEGHLNAKFPWLPYHENLTAMTARLVGAKPEEVVVMNSLTTNLHLMMVSFYNPTKERYKILIEGGAFPSDQYAVASQATFHGFDPADAILELTPRSGEEILRTEDILAYIEEHGESIALVLLGSCNYLTGQAFELEKIAAAARKKGCRFGVNLAHGAGNLELKLHDWGLDFAVWCSYKYLNAGPGAIAGCFVHERQANNPQLKRFTGWWGHDKKTRFLMGPEFVPIPGAEGWQLSNPPIFQLAALRASMEIFDKAGMPAIRHKGDLLTGYLEFLLDRLPENSCQIITPRNKQERGCQLSIRVSKKPKELVENLKANNAICDFREPDIIRVAPCPLYNSFHDVYRFVNVIGALWA
ncbi:MAG: kynureninase [Candidatus Obscuribacterales bacterium]|nr:kynureninase [Candidatus Obscuribacterales bacterium]